MDDVEWSKKVSGFAIDALVRAKLLPDSSFNQAQEIMAEEIIVRLSLNDRPVNVTPDR